MNAFERASRDMLVALVIEANQGSSSIPDLEILRSRYNLKINDILLPSSIEEWDNRGLLIVSRTFDGTGACIRPGNYGSALSALLELIDATTFDVSWKKEEVLTDATIWPDFPTPNGWKILTFEKALLAPLDRRANVISSSSWTGLPSNFELAEEQRLSLVRELEAVEQTLTSLDIGQEAKAQVRAYVISARYLAEAPTPPSDLIWELVQRANSVAGIASLFLSIFALFI